VVRDQPRFGENVVQRYREKYIPIQQRYLRDQRPRDHADIVINNENPDDPQVVGQQTIHS